MKLDIFFIHGAGPQGPHEGSDDLVRYLRNSLGIEYKLHHPIMPDPENPRYQDWKMALQSILPIGGNKVLLVGHSLGGSVIVKYLSEGLLQMPIAGLFLIATPFWGARGWNMDEFTLEKNFQSKLPDIDKTFIYHSRNDTWVPYTHANSYASKLKHTVVRTVTGDQHNFDNGLPQLLKDIRSLNL